MGSFLDILTHEAEERRLFPWAVVLFGIGITVCFSYSEFFGSIIWTVVVGITACFLAYWERERFLARTVLCGLVFFCLGCFSVQWRIISSKDTVLTRTIIADMSGVIESVDMQTEYARIVVSHLKIKHLDQEKVPEKIRLRVKVHAPLEAGKIISAKIRIYPPPPPALPRGYDFARDAFFKGIGGVGRVLGAYSLKDNPEKMSFIFSLMVKIDRARNILTDRIVHTIGGQSGAVSAALITGKRGFIDEETDTVLRGAGIYHVVSISGLHMVLAAGIFFWLVRAVLAMSPYLALLWPIKKIAACIAMLGAVLYCVFAGAEVATVRSLIMTLVMLGAVLADRSVLSIRNVSFAAFLVLFREPEALLGPSFQMSFSAVLALMALAEWLQKRPKTLKNKEYFLLVRLFRNVKKTIFLAFATTLVAGLATAPFAAYHFQVTQNYSIIGNALTLPLISFVVMPSALIGTMFYPLGLDTPVWFIMGGATEIVLDVSGWVAALPYSIMTLPQFSVGAIVFLTFSILIATLPTFRMRKYALAPALLGLWMSLTPERFAVAVDRNGTGAVIRSDDGKLQLVGRANRFQMEQWLRADGDKRFLLLSDKKRSSELDGFRAQMQCDENACIGKGKGIILSVVQNPLAFYEDCRRADVIVSRFYAPSYCQAKVILDRSFLNKHGATYIFKSSTAATYRIETSR